MSAVMDVPQHMSALAKAQISKQAQLRLRSEIRALELEQGASLVASLVEADKLYPEVAAIRVLTLLTSVKRVGELRAYHLLKAIDVHLRGHEIKVHELTQRQRHALAELLRGAR